MALKCHSRWDQKPPSGCATLVALFFVALFPHRSELAPFARAFYDSPKRPAMVNFIAGLGGREVTVKDGEEMFNLLQRGAAGDLTTNVHWIGVRE